MVWSGTFATELDCQYKEGKNVSTGITETIRNSFILQAESLINAVTRFNWTDAYASLNADVKYILTEAASNLVAMYSINYDMSAYASRNEAETMLNLLRDKALLCLALLEDQKVKIF